MQGKPCTVIYNGYFACDKGGNRQSLPSRRLSKSSTAFHRNSRIGSFKTDAGVVTNVLRLMSHSSRIHVPEDAALSKMRKPLSDLLGVYSGGLYPDGRVLRMMLRANKTQSDSFLSLFSNTNVRLAKSGVALPFEQHILFKIFCTRTRHEHFVGFTPLPIRFPTRSLAQGAHQQVLL